MVNPPKNHSGGYDSLFFLKIMVGIIAPRSDRNDELQLYNYK